jgi:S-(hydroxymethyl)glutathione dehydrogenase/alcohol dehydrogenase
VKLRFSAAVLHEVGAVLQVEELEMSCLKPTDVLVRVQASGLCHTDLEVVEGALKAPLPIALGHEGAGIVEAVGQAVTRVKPDDHVVCSWNPNCGHCFYCAQDQPILCETFARNSGQGALMDGISRLRGKAAAVHHHSFVSSHAEYCVVPEAGAIPVPRDIPFDRACLLGCAVMTGVGGATKVAKVAVGSSVAVFGCGAVGLNVLQGARLSGARRIIAIDLDARKLAMALTFGATDTVNPSTHDPVEGVRQLTAGRGADYTFEAAGNERCLQQALEGARPGGRIVILGKVNVDRYVSLRFGSLIGEKQITRSSYGGARPALDFPLLAGLYLDGKLKLDELITRRIALEDINSGLHALKEGNGVRTVVTFPN